MDLGRLMPPNCRQCQEPGEIPVSHPAVPPDSWVCSAECAIELGKTLATGAAPAPVVHLLRAGAAVCLFTALVPKLWPAGHWRTGYIDEVTCPDCKAILRRQP